MAACLFIFLKHGRACGGGYYLQTIIDSSDRNFLRSPIASFRKELERLKPRKAAHMAVITKDSFETQTRAAEMKDIREAVREYLGFEDERRDEIAVRYEILRTTASLTEQDRQDIPKEFILYALGAAKFHMGDKTAAVGLWRELIELPAEMRRYRTTWAAYMVGRTLLDSTPSESIAWFRLVRQAASEGFKDTLGLAAASYGWEALAELRLKNYANSIELYLEHYASGHNSAVMSLRTAAGRMFRDNTSDLARAAKRKNVRQFVNAHIVSAQSPIHGYRGGPIKQVAERWLSALEKAGPENMECADRIGWVAYKAGDFETAARWLDFANPDSAIYKWIRSKLLLREGKTEEAIPLLAELVRTFPKNSEEFYYASMGNHHNYFSYRNSLNSVYGELGTLQLARGQYVKALDILIRGGYWTDGAYIAERVLSLEEFKSYVDEFWPDSDSDSRTGRSNEEGHEWRIRYLLGRRLARHWKWEEARPYYPEERVEYFDGYVAAMKKGRDYTASESEQVKWLLKAARILREDGMDIIGTSFEYRRRTEKSFAEQRQEAAENEKIISLGKDEALRAERHRTIPEQRFHFRFVAAELAWEAANIMPDQDNETARVLCEAGSWIKYLDPGVADKFYKALVIRCGKTELGKAADQKRWFPDQVKLK
jgi:tetratricopeptide (TPR) repeat protein